MDMELKHKKNLLIALTDSVHFLYQLLIFYKVFFDIVVSVCLVPIRAYCIVFVSSKGEKRRRKENIREEERRREVEAR